MDIVLIVMGGALMGGSLLSGIAHRTFLSLTPLFIGVGMIFGSIGFDVITIDPTDTIVVDLAIIALIVILFRDGIEVEQELLLDHWHLPVRKLLLAMPLTAIIAACAAHWLLGTDWLVSFLIGAIISPTDPILSSAVVTNPRVPAKIRHTLNLESGLNDGLALPAILIMMAALTKQDFVWWSFLLQDIGVGIGIGVVLGFVAAWLVNGTHSRHAMALYALGVAGLTYGLAHELHGNGFISVFVCAVVLGIRRQDIAAAFEHGSTEIVEVIKLAVFVVFGAIISWATLSGTGWLGLLFALSVFFLARPIAVALSLIGTRTPLREVLFLGWFGPRGIATMVFSLFVLAETRIVEGELVFSIAALTVVLSVILHSMTDTPGAHWIAGDPEPDDEEHLVPGVDPTLLTAGASATIMSFVQETEQTSGTQTHRGVTTDTNNNVLKADTDAKD